MSRESKRNLRFWDKFANKYDSFTDGFNKTYHELIPKIGEFLQTDNKVLEVAAGTGKVTFGICDKVSSIAATDFSSQMIEIALQKASELQVKNVTFEVQDATALLYDNNSFDTCIFVNALHVMPSPEKALAEIRRTLKPGGRLIVPTYCHGDNLKSQIVSRIMGLGGFKAYTRFSVESLEKFLIDNGFDIEYREIIPETPPIAFFVLRKR